MNWTSWDEENVLDFAITGRGNILVASKKDGDFQDHADAALLHKHVQRGNSTNLLVIRKEGQRIRFYANGYQVYEMSPPRFFGSGVGFMIYNNLKIDFDDLVVTTKTPIR